MTSVSSATRIKARAPAVEAVKLARSRFHQVRGHGKFGGSLRDHLGQDFAEPTMRRPPCARAEFHGVRERAVPYLQIPNRMLDHRELAELTTGSRSAR